MGTSKTAHVDNERVRKTPIVTTADLKRKYEKKALSDDGSKINTEDMLDICLSIFPTAYVYDDIMQQCQTDAQQLYWKGDIPNSAVLRLFADGVLQFIDLPLLIKVHVDAIVQEYSHKFYERKSGSEDYDWFCNVLGSYPPIDLYESQPSERERIHALLQAQLDSLQEAIDTIIK